MHQMDHQLSVYLTRLGLYPYTDDMVYEERKFRHTFSSWPLVYETLLILRISMVLDDLATA